MNLLDRDDFSWDRYQGTSLGRKVDYSGTVLSVHDDNHVDVLYRWEPGTYCHFHRHIAPISSVVLEGELHIYDYENGVEVGKRVRKVGSYAHRGEIEDHIEQGGPEGALVMFSLYAPDGVLTQQLDDDGNPVADITIADIKARVAALLGS